MRKMRFIRVAMVIFWSAMMTLPPSAFASGESRSTLSIETASHRFELLPLAPVSSTPAREAPKEVEPPFSEVANPWAAADAAFRMVTQFVATIPRSCDALPMGSSSLNQELGRCIVTKRGLNGAQFDCLDRIWGGRESGWRNTAKNPSSTAYGIAQFLDGTWRAVGIAKTANPYLQIEAGLRYIEGRYGTPCSALAFHRNHGWY